MAERPETILVPLDASKLATVAVDYAAMLAEATGARLVLFTAVGGAEREALEEFAAHEHISTDEAAEAHLRRVAAGVENRVTIEHHHAHSENPAASIADYATDHGVSMIVMSSHGRSGVGRWLLGSVATKVLGISPVPVTVVPVRS